MENKYKLNKSRRNQFLAGAGLVLIMALMLFGYLYEKQMELNKDEASIVGQRIVASIQAELRRCYDTTELICDLYSVHPDVFLREFRPICEQLLEDNIVIGSMYWAPGGVIKYSYPDKVDEATSNFEMLKDPVQGPKAQKALNDKKATIAGPHDLIEGGKGFILRNPYFSDEGEFVGFSIMVVDTKQFLGQVLNNLTEKEAQNYCFAVWKDDDPTAVLDENGFMLCNGDGAELDGEVVLPFDAPNDKWYLTIQPMNGWHSVLHMKNEFLTLLLIYIFVCLSLYYALYTDQIRHNLEISELEKDKTRAANEAKTSFLFNMSHDIRTPMNAIMGFRDLLEKWQEDPVKRADYLRKIEDASNVLLSIINNVLEMARIEKGTVELDESVWSTEQFNDSIYSIFTEMMTKKGLEFVRSIDVKHPYVYCDPIKLREIFINLLSNAYKYTTHGKVSMDLKELESDREGYCLYQTTISDTGMGISKEFLPHLFEEFARESNTTEIKIEGTGLGMPIVKRLIDLMGGTIEVSSEKGVGTTVVVTIYHRIGDRSSLVEKGDMVVDPKLFEGKRILLAEDNDLNAEIAQEILQESGFVVERAEDGQACCDMLKKADENYFDIILMDIQMPNMNGYEATKSIRRMNNGTKANIPILALTANAFEEDRRQAMKCGMSGHLAKPINVHDLMRELAKRLS